jgi:hypothetical protein
MRATGFFGNADEFQAPHGRNPGRLSLLARLVPLVAALLGSTPATAQVSYDYTGSFYLDGAASAPFTTSMRLAAHFELPSALAPNTVNFSPSFYSLSNGISTFSSADSQPSFMPQFSRYAFQVSTDAAGAINDWLINVLHLGSTLFEFSSSPRFDYAVHGSYAIAYPTTSTPAGQTSAAVLMLNSGGYGATDVGGSWSVTTAIPEPETYAMLLGGLGMLAFARRRARRRLNG